MPFIDLAYELGYNELGDALASHEVNEWRSESLKRDDGATRSAVFLKLLGAWFLGRVVPFLEKQREERWCNLDGHAPLVAKRLSIEVPGIM